MFERRKIFIIVASLVSGLLASSCSFSFWNKDVNRGLTIIGLPDTISELRIDGERIDTSFAVKNGGYFVSSYDNTLELCDNGKKTFPLYDYQTTDMFRDDGTYKLTIYFSVQESSLFVNSYKVWLSVVFIDGNARIIWDEGESVDYENSVREYNQEKAGAKIVASYDLSTIIPWATSYVTLASYKDIYYLFVNETIHLIDKDSMEKIGEINVTIPETVSFAPIENQLAIFDDKIMFGTSVTFGKTSVFLMDMDGKNLREVAIPDELGIYFQISKLGYNQSNGTVWFYGSRESSIFNYTYNDESDSFTRVEDIDLTDFYIDKDFSLTAIDGNEIRHGYASYYNVVWPQLCITNYNIQTASEIYHRIQIPYLGVNPPVPPDIVFYDFPFVLTVVIEKDGKIQLLKLLPTEKP